MKSIKLTQEKEAIVDDKYFALLSQRKWYFKRGRHGRGYAVTTINRKQIYMHVLIYILEYGIVPEGHDIDHINTVEPLDNRIINLRLADRCQNAQNRVVSKNKASCQYKGVYFRKDKKSKPWVATIQANKKRYHLGFFDTAEQAAEAYNAASLRLHGEFSHLNIIEFPEDGKEAA